MVCTIYAPWFGELPFYTKEFLYSCAKSPNIQWVIHSDQEAPEIADNILWARCNNLHQLIVESLTITVPLRSWGHKLCDLKPFWHTIFNVENLLKTKYRGWCDWDVVHDLSTLEFTFDSAKFTKGSMCSPLFIQKVEGALEVYPRDFGGLLKVKPSCAWDELYYLKNINSTILQEGLTPEVDLFFPAKYAVHMYRAKHCPDLYDKWLKKYFKSYR